MSEQRKTIWKFPLSRASDISEVPMPIGAQVLTVQLQHGNPCIWALVDPTAEVEIRRFRMAGTGHSLDETGRHIGTIQMAGGDLIFHFFELEAKSV